MGHIDAKQPRFFKYMGVARPPCEPCGCVMARDVAKQAFTIEIGGVDMQLGTWWLDAAARGALPRLPLVNLEPQFEGETPMGSTTPAADRQKKWLWVPPPTKPAAAKIIQRSWRASVEGGAVIYDAPDDDATDAHDEKSGPQKETKEKPKLERRPSLPAIVPDADEADAPKKEKPQLRRRPSF